jgi:hypothetical protein
MSWLCTTVGHLAVNMFRQYHDFRGWLQQLEILTGPELGHDLIMAAITGH